MKNYDLRIEYRKNPIGLDMKQPRFSWKMESEEKDTKQKSYHITVKEIVDSRENEVWDSKVVESDISVLVAYAGEELKPETLYTICVEVEDNHGNKASAQGTFETGIFDNTQFSAQMITHDFLQEETACPVFFKEFKLEKPVVKARLYATAQGVYEVNLNGSRVGDYRMAPGWTSYHHRLQYQIYDVTEMLSQDNKIEMTVGNGWYKGIFGFYCQPNIYGDRVGAFAELHVTYEDGATAVIGTDESWGVRTGEIQYSEIYMGKLLIQ